MVYMTRVRKEVESVFGAFDCPDGNQVTPKRTRSTTPLQALNLLNSAFVLQQAEFLAERLKSESDAPEQWMETSYKLCFGRPPTQKEVRLASQMLEELGLTQYCRVLLNSNEFVFVLCNSSIRRRAVAAASPTIRTRLAQATTMNPSLQNRRDFLGSTTSGLAGIALASLLQQDGLLADEETSGRPVIPPDRPFSSMESFNPEDLWDWMDAVRAREGDSCHVKDQE